MRKPAVLAALFPTVRGNVLAATLTQPGKWWYLSELAQFLGTSPSSLQRELKALVDGGILETRREGTRAYFKADTQSPVFPELRGLIDKTAGVVPTLRDLLRPFESRIAWAFVYGSVARSQEHAQSDVDLLVVGDIGLAGPSASTQEGRGQARTRSQRDQLFKGGIPKKSRGEGALPVGGPSRPQTIREGRPA